jgi:hypothetical protein
MPTRTWKLADGYWINDAGWLEGIVPTAADNVYVPNGRVIVAYSVFANGITVGSGSGSGSIVLTGTGSINSNVTLASAQSSFILNANYVSQPTLQYAGNISGNGFVSVQGGLLEFGRYLVSRLILSGTNNYSGSTTIDATFLQAGSDGAFSPNSVYVFVPRQFIGPNYSTYATIDLAGFNVSVGGLSGEGTVTSAGRVVGSQTVYGSLLINNTGMSTFSGNIFLNDIIKTGSGTQILAGGNIYTNLLVPHTMTIQDGTLALSGLGLIARFDVAMTAATAKFDISAISAASSSINGLNFVAGSEVILGGKTLRIGAAVNNMGAGSFVGSGGADAVIFNVSGSVFSLAGVNGPNFTNWTDGVDSITINGNSGPNTLTGDEVRATTIIGNVSNDTIMGGAGNDILDGGGGIDTVSYANSAFGVTVHLNNTAAQNTVHQGMDTLHNFENIIGSAAHDSLWGDAGDNTISGGAGFDYIVSGGGTNTLIGGADGDTYIVQGLNDNVIEAVGGGYDTVLAQSNFVLTAGSEVEAMVVDTAAGLALTGNDFRQVMTGGAGNDVLSAGGGNDRLISGAGINTLIGGTGDDIYYAQGVNDVITELAGGGYDVVLAGGNLSLAANSEVEVIAVNTTSGVTITGSDSNQTILGGAGNDRFIGGLGNDTLTGSGGADTFVLRNTFAGRDFIRDFTSGSDKIEISAALFGGGLSAGGLTAAQFLSGAGVVSATTAAQRFIYNSSTGNLYFDADGNGAGASVIIANLSNVGALTASDFIITAAAEEPSTPKGSNPDVLDVVDVSKVFANDNVVSADVFDGGILFTDQIIFADSGLERWGQVYQPPFV